MNPEFSNLLHAILHQTLSLQSLTVSKVLVVIIVNVELYFPFPISQVDLYPCYLHKNHKRRKETRKTDPRTASKPKECANT